MVGAVGGSIVSELIHWDAVKKDQPEVCKVIREIYAREMAWMSEVKGRASAYLEVLFTYQLTPRLSEEKRQLDLIIDCFDEAINTNLNRCNIVI